MGLVVQWAEKLPTVCICVLQHPEGSALRVGTQRGFMKFPWGNGGGAAGQELKAKGPLVEGAREPKGPKQARHGKQAKRREL